MKLSELSDEEKLLIEGFRDDGGHEREHMLFCAQRAIERAPTRCGTLLIYSGELHSIVGKQGEDTL